jgi:hypothetical protein
MASTLRGCSPWVWRIGCTPWVRSVIVRADVRGRTAGLSRRRARARGRTGGRGRAPDDSRPGHSVTSGSVPQAEQVDDHSGECGLEQGCPEPHVARFASRHSATSFRGRNCHFHNRPESERCVSARSRLHGVGRIGPVAWGRLRRAASRPRPPGVAGGPAVRTRTAVGLAEGEDVAVANVCPKPALSSTVHGQGEGLARY